MEFKDSLMEFKASLMEFKGSSMSKKDSSMNLNLWQITITNHSPPPLQSAANQNSKLTFDNFIRRPNASKTVSPMREAGRLLISTV